MSPALCTLSREQVTTFTALPLWMQRTLTDACVEVDVLYVQTSLMGGGHVIRGKSASFAGPDRLPRALDYLRAEQARYEGRIANVQVVVVLSRLPERGTHSTETPLC